jgi:hypothetical protein
METKFPRRIEDFEFTARGCRTARKDRWTRIEFIAQASIWPLPGAEGQLQNFNNLGVFDTEDDAVRVATNYAEYWIRSEMLKRKR